MSIRRVIALLVSLSLVGACTSTVTNQSISVSDIARRISLVSIADVPAPVAFATRPGDPDDVAYVASQSGAVLRIDLSTGRTEQVASFADRTKAEGERGLLGLAFSASGDEMYAHFTDRNGDTNVVAVPVIAGRPDLSSARLVFFHEQPYANHNGGQLVVDASGALLIGLGDGGSGGDPQGNAQNRSSLLGKILRIVPRPASSSTAYSIPADNPYVGSATTAPEILFLGLRNPWRFSIDTTTGDYWIADVGQNSVEEIDRISASGVGANLGWNVREGSRPFEGATSEVLTDPVVEWTNTGGSAAIGGFVYRGSAIPALQGRYVFADFGRPGLLAFDTASGETVRLDLPVRSVVAFGVDRSGELYVLSLETGVLALRPAR